MAKAVTIEEYAMKRSKGIELLKKYGVALIFLLPFLAAFITFFLFPFFYGIYISLTNFQYSNPGVETFNDFKWYSVLFNKSVFPLLNKSFWMAFLRTIIFVIIMVPIAIVLPLALALLINLKPPGFKLFRALIYMPSIVPLTASGVIFTLLFMSRSERGLVDTFFGLDISWFVDTWFKFTIGGETFEVVYAWIPIFLMCLWGGWGGNFIILSAGLSNIPKHLYEAADMDGCSAWKKILNVTIPGIKPQLVLCLFTTIIGYMGLYGQNFVLVSGGPIDPEISGMPAGGHTGTLMYFIQDIVANNTNFKASLYGLGAASSLVFASFVGIFSGIQMYLTRTRKTGVRISEEFYKWQRIR